MLKCLEFVIRLSTVLIMAAVPLLPLHADRDACVPALTTLAEAALRAKNVSKINQLIASPLTRLHGFTYFSPDEAMEAGPNAKHVYISILPGKAKHLRKGLSQAEVNSLLNEIRAHVLNELRTSGFSNSDIHMIFKGVSVSVPNYGMSKQDMMALEARLNGAIASVLKARHPSALSLLERYGLSAPQYVQIGLSDSEHLAVLSSRYKGEATDAESIRDELIAEFQELVDTAKELSMHVRIDDELFSALRKHETIADLKIYLLESQPEILVSDPNLPEKIWKLWKALKLFAPTPKFRQQDIETFNAEKITQRSQHYHEAERLLVMDLMGAGSRVMSELFESVAGLNPKDDRETWEIIKNITTPKSIAWIHSKLDQAQSLIQDIAGDDLIDLWVTGDEIHFIIKNSVIDRLADEDFDGFRFTENNGFIGSNRDLGRIDITENVLKILENYAKSNGLNESRFLGESDLVGNRVKLRVIARGINQNHQAALEELVESQLGSDISIWWDWRD